MANSSSIVPYLVIIISALGLGACVISQRRQSKKRQRMQRALEAEQERERQNYAGGLARMRTRQAQQGRTQTPHTPKQATQTKFAPSGASSNTDDALLSMSVSAATGSTLMGYAAGGSMLGAMAGEAISRSGSSDCNTYDSSSGYSSCGDGGGDGGGD